MTAARRPAATIRVAPAGREHAGIIAHLAAGDTTAPWSAEAVARMLGLPGCWVLLAIAPGDEPVGFVMARVAADEAEILNLVVAAGARRRGVGGALLGAALRRARRAGASAMYLEVAADNQAGRALYRSAGFRAVGTRTDYYRKRDGNYADAIIMKRAIVKSAAD